jgi:hypothetical protein
MSHFLLQLICLMLFFISTITAVYFSVFWKHSSYSCMGWRTRRQTLSCCLFLLICVMQTNQTQHVTCNMTVVPASGTFSAFVKFWYIFCLHKFHTLAVETYVAVLILYFNLCIAANISLLHYNWGNFLCKVSHDFDA